MYPARKPPGISHSLTTAAEARLFGASPAVPGQKKGGLLAAPHQKPAQAGLNT